MNGYAREIRRNSTAKSVVVQIEDVSTDLPAVSVGDATTGLVMKYYRLGTQQFDVSIPPVSITNLSSGHNPGGIKHIANGWYRIDVPDAALVTGADGVLILVTVAGMRSDGAYISLVDRDVFTGLPKPTAEVY